MGQLDAMHIKYDLHGAGRDLGVDLPQGRRRSAPILASRLHKAQFRAKRIRKLAKVGGPTRKLVSAGVYPSATYAASIWGLAPAQLKKLRTATAAAYGHAIGGMCTTTVLAIEGAEPMYRYIKGMVL